jgi:hypothetical protein
MDTTKASGILGTTKGQFDEARPELLNFSQNMVYLFEAALDLANPSLMDYWL